MLAEGGSRSSFRPAVHRRDLLAGACALISAPALMNAANAQARPLIPISEQSVMSLYIQPRINGRPLGNGTGFVVNGRKGPVLLTAKHVVTGHTPDGKPLSLDGVFPDELAIRHTRKDQLGSWVVTVEPLKRDGKPAWVEHQVLREKADFVSLQLTQLDEVGFHFYELTNTARIVIGPADTVSVIGFPFGISAGGLAVWATGFVASDIDVDFGGLPLFLIDCRSRQGQSGSPVIAYRGGGAMATETGTTVFSGPVYRFLGLYTGRINSESDLGMVWKAAAIRELVEST